MSKELIDILYNPSSINSILGEESVAVASHLTTEVPDSVLTHLCALIKFQGNAKETFEGMVRLKRMLTLPIPPALRQLVLKNFNTLITTLSANQTANIDVFQCTIQITTLLKEHVESQPQKSGSALRSEWVELEKMIYNLSAWEGQLDYFWSAVQ